MKPQCPICKKPVPARSENPSYPFCCSRCKMVDLGNWFAGSYVLSRPIDPEADAEAIELFMAENLDGDDPPKH